MPPRKRARTATHSATNFTNIPKNEEALAQHIEQTAALYQAGELCDGEVRHGSTTYAVSRMNLAAASKFFRIAFTGGMRESSGASITLDPSMPAACVETLLHYAHSGELRVPEGFEEELVSAADQLEFLSVLPSLTPRLIETVNAENCLNRLTLAARRSLDDLTARAVQAADEHFIKLAASDAFNELPEEALTALLSSEQLTVAEVQLYEMLVAWHAHDTRRRFDALLAHISLTDLGVKYLLDSVMHSPLVLASAPARDLVRDAMGRLTLSPVEIAQLPSPRTTRRNRAIRLDLHFHRPNECPFLVLRIADAGKLVWRAGGSIYRGAFGTEHLPTNARALWRLELTPSTHYAASKEQKFFVGIAREDVTADSQRTDGCVGIEIINPHAGDTLSLTSDPTRQVLEYSFELTGTRTIADVSASVQSEFQASDVEIGANGTLTWPSSGTWKPFVSMTHGTYGGPMDICSRIRAVEM